MVKMPRCCVRKRFPSSGERATERTAGRPSEHDQVDAIQFGHDLNPFRGRTNVVVIRVGASATGDVLDVDGRSSESIISVAPKRPMKDHLPYRSTPRGAIARH